MIMFQDLGPTGTRFTTYLPAGEATARILQATAKQAVC
jgi:hypothetical protein